MVAEGLLSQSRSVPQKVSWTDLELLQLGWAESGSPVHETCKIDRSIQEQACNERKTGCARMDASTFSLYITVGISP
jgi:hypothetical protein